jgi:hypothetical protein
MRIAAAFLAAALPVAVMAQADQRDDPSRTRVEVTGCVKGSTLTETSLHAAEPVRDEGPVRRWRVRGPKALMRQMKDYAGKELRIAGTTKDPRAGLVLGAKRIGRSNVYIGGNVDNGATRDPLPEQPTVDVESFEATGAVCR